VTHEKAGRAFAYLPLVDQGQARRSALSHLLARFFDNSPELLVLDLLKRDALDAVEVQRVRDLLDAGAEDEATPDKEPAK